MRRSVLTVCVALGVLFLCGLGTWQIARLQWKLELIERVEGRASGPPVPFASVAEEVLSGEFEYGHVSLSGGFPTDQTAHVFGTYQGQPGWFVFQPFSPDGTDGIGLGVLVNRGFVTEEERQATYVLPDAERLTGLVRYYEDSTGLADVFAPPPDLEAGSLYDRRKETFGLAFSHVAGYLEPDAAAADAFLPFYLDSTLPTQLPRGGATRLDFSNRHLGYAITWFGLAGGLIAVYAAMMRRR